MALSRKKKFIIGGVVAAVLAAIVIVSIFASNKEQVEVTTQKIEPRKELRSTVTASGEVRPIQYINLTSEVQGRNIRQWPCKPEKAIICIVFVSV